MSRWIDVEWLMKYFKRGKGYKGEYVLDDLKHDAPSIDIVRCKDCRWYKDFDGCFFSTAEVEEDGFCSYGEREGE